MTPGSAATVTVIDDDQDVRASLAWLIESAGYSVHTFPDAEQALSRMDPSCRGCILLDVRMPGMTGLELQRRLKARQVGVPIIFITGHGDIPVAVQAMREGAFDFVLKPLDEQVLLTRIHEAVDEDGRRRQIMRSQETVGAKLARLTPREKQVLDGVVSGLPNRQIAQRLGLSAKTVEVYRARVMDKMEAPSLAALVRMLVEAGKL